MLENALQHTLVAPYPIVLEVATQFLAPHPVLGWQGCMTRVTTPLPEQLLGSAYAFTGRLPLDDPVAPARFRPEMGKSEKLECAVPRVGILVEFRLPKRNQRGLRGMNGETKAVEPLRQYVHESAGVVFPFKADDELIRETNQEASPFHPWFDLVLVPFIQYLVKEYIG
jgi:hypothetical protein